MNISDTENDAETIRCLRVRKRNKRLRSEEKEDSIQILSIEQPSISEKTLETLWKLYRNAGETIEDVKLRLVDMPSVKTEFCFQSDNNYNVKNMTASIKDGDDESFYSENESAEKDEEDSAKDSRKVKDMKNLKNIPTKKIKIEKRSESTDCDSICEQPLCLSEILTVEIQESGNTIQFPCDLEVDSIKDQECTNDSTFKVTTLRASESLVEPIPNCTYAVPRLRQITNAELVVANKIITRASRNKNAGVKIEVKEEIPSSDDDNTIRDLCAKLTDVKPRTLKKRLSSCEDDEPIIKEMHGVRTRSYNLRAPKVEIPKCFKVSKLSDNEEIELFDQSSWKGSLNAAGSSSIKRETKWSDNFLCTLTVNLSSDSDISELEKRNVKQRKLSTVKTKNTPKISKSSETSSSLGSSSCTCTHSPCSGHSYYTRSSCSCSTSSTSSTSTKSDENNNDE